MFKKQWEKSKAISKISGLLYKSFLITQGNWKCIINLQWKEILLCKRYFQQTIDLGLLIQRCWNGGWSEFTQVVSDRTGEEGILHNSVIYFPFA